ncbi:MAG: chromate transporter [Candidatus Limnocylindrales bacterium]
MVSPAVDVPAGEGAARPLPVTGEGAAPRGRVVPGVAELFTTFFAIGLTSFGMAILQNIRSVPVRRGWIDRQEIDEGLGLVQLYPGAIMVDLVAYIGYRIHRVVGAVAATAGFVTPALVLMLGLSWLYATYGAAPAVTRLVVGLDAIVVGVVASVAIDFALQHARGTVPALLALAGFAVAVSGATLLLAVLGGLALGAVLVRPSRAGASLVGSGARATGGGNAGGGDPSPGPVSPGSAGAPGGESAPAPADEALSWRRIGMALVPGAAVVVAAAVATAAGGVLSTVFLDITRIGTVAFGNGSTILPVLQQDVVDSRHWLSLSQFGVAIGFGQVTPGPFLISAAFVGYRVAGLWGGVLAAVAIFAPSVAMTTVAAEIYPVLRRWAWVKGALAGVMAVFVGLLASVALTLGRPLLAAPGALILLASAFVAVRMARWNLLVVFGGGLAAWAAYLALGGH